MVETFSFLCFRTTIWYILSQIQTNLEICCITDTDKYTLVRNILILCLELFSLFLLLYCHAYVHKLHKWKRGRPLTLHKVKEMEGENNYCHPLKGVIYTEYPRFLCRSIFNLIEMKMMISGSLHLVPLFKINCFHRPRLLHVYVFALNVFLRKAAQQKSSCHIKTCL